MGECCVMYVTDHMLRRVTAICVIALVSIGISAAAPADSLADAPDSAPVGLPDAALAGASADALAGETNLALGRNVTASSVFSMNPSSSTAPSSAVDGDLDTKWLSAMQYGQEQWIIVDLESVYEIHRCEILADYGDRPMSYRVDCSIDGLEFSVFAERSFERIDGQSHSPADEPYIDTGRKIGRFVRLVITGVQGGMTSARIRELRIYGTESRDPVPPEAAGVSFSGRAADTDERQERQHNGNPILPGYFADPSVVQFDDWFYIYSTCDLAPQPVVWRSKDFVNWSFTGVAMPYMGIWAPSVTRVGGTYYMYYTFDHQIYVAVSSSPEGPWTSNKLLVARGDYDCWAIDAEVFVDDDGQAYLYFGNGRCFVAKLADDMVSFAEPAVDITPIHYFEGPYVFKRGDIYYLMWSQYGFQDPRYQVHYAMGRSPLGPFEYQAGNPILRQDTSIHITGTGHHSVLNPRGTDDYYIVYHRHEIPYVDGTHRQICVDRMEFANDGRILRVMPTHTGVGPLGPTEPAERNLALYRPATASSHSEPAAGPELAFDGKFSTRWQASDATKPQWLAVDLGATYLVKRCVLAFEFISEYTQYRIEVSTDGVTWSTFADMTSNTRVIYPLENTGEAVARYVRAVVTGTQTQGRPAGLFELEVYGDVVDGGDSEQ